MNIQAKAKVEIADHDVIMRAKIAGDYLKTRYGFGSKSTLDKLRITGDGPKYLRIGPKTISYRKADIDAWVLNRTVEMQSTSEVVE